MSKYPPLVVASCMYFETYFPITIINIYQQWRCNISLIFWLKLHLGINNLINAIIFCYQSNFVHITSYNPRLMYFRREAIFMLNRTYSYYRIRYTKVIIWILYMLHGPKRGKRFRHIYSIYCTYSVHTYTFIYICFNREGLESWWLIVEVQIFNDTDLCQRFIS